MLDHAKDNIYGHVLIRDIDTGEVLVDQHNDIHLKNFCDSMAESLANFSSGFIEEMHFGNGGSVVNSTGSVVYSATNTQTPDASLCNPTYKKVVNDRSANFFDDQEKNNIKVSSVFTNAYTDIIVTCTLGFGEPGGQLAFDNATTTDGDYTFDELGLMTEGGKRLLTHVVFHPVQKSINRSIEIIYTVRISVSN